MKCFTAVLQSETGLLTQSRTLWNLLTWVGWALARSHAQIFQNVKIQKRAENISFSKSLQEPITFQHRDLSALKGKYQRFLEIRISENSFFLSFRWSGKLKMIFALKLKLSCRLNWDLMI